MRQVLETIRPREGIPGGLQSNRVRWRKAWESQWHAGGTGNTGSESGSTSDMSGSTSNHSRAVWEKHHLREHCWCVWTSYLLLIVQRFLKLMYSVCIPIYVSMYLYCYPSTHGESGLAAGGAWEQFNAPLEMTMEQTQRYTPRLWLSKVGDPLGCCNQPDFQTH
jgi:hypothetical protein